jgi:DNA-binding IclR family transcriptional regulator
VPDDDSTPSSDRTWTFLTNHAHVLLAVASAPDLRLREIAELVGITERTAMQIVVDLERGGYLHRERRGRRNHYAIDDRLHLRHPLEEHHEVSSLLRALEHRPPPAEPTEQPA